MDNDILQGCLSKVTAHTAVDGNVNTGSGDFVGRDKVSQQIQTQTMHVHLAPPSFPDVAPEGGIALVLDRDFHHYRLHEQEQLLEAIRHLLLAGMGTVEIVQVRL